LRSQVTISSRGVPGVKISATPAFLSAVMSSSGTMPPLKRGLDHHCRRLSKPRVDDLEAGVAERPGDHLDAAVVAVEPDLGEHDAQGLDPRRGRQMIAFSV
jgi:hypothetical protein